jgi:hypothetical protein
MIYESASGGEPIRQGDIFNNIPRVDFSFASMAILDGEEAREIAWKDAISNSSSPVVAAVPVKPVTGIVITQDCDTVRGEYICLAEVADFATATGKTLPTLPKKWQSLIKQHAKTNLRWFYLPAGGEFGITSRMAVDFRVLLRVPRGDLEEHREFRLCRLNPVSREHFRESLAQFFRRYPYNEWYPLTKEEFQAYSEESPEPVKPYPWQE